ncbi:hypothetical protein KQI84_01940 [bacterium]|nr:hypothetical protein [bacterium]
MDPKARVLVSLLVVLVWCISPAPAGTTADFILPQGPAGKAEPFSLNVHPVALTSGLPVRVQLDSEHDYQMQLQPAVLRGPESGTWTGQINGELDSHVQFTLEEGELYGEIHRNAEDWQIVRGPSGNYVAMAMEPREDFCAPPLPSRPAGMIGVDPRMDDDGSEIDVLFVYTPNAGAAVGGASGLRTRLRAAADGTNQAYIASQITTRIRVVGMREITYTESGDSQDELNALQGFGDGRMDDVHTLRDQLGADLVMLIADYTPDGFCGRGYLLTSQSTANAGFGFSVVAPTCTDIVTIAHEFGHNMGCAHDRPNAGPVALFPYSYGYSFFDNTGLLRRTIMSYPPGSQIFQFSNPNLTFNGVATGEPAGSQDGMGNPTSADAAQTINLSRTTVAAFRTQVLPSIIASNATAAESSGSPTDILVPVTLSFATNQPVTASWSLAPVSAVPGFDYEDRSGFLTIPAGSTSTNVSLRILDDQFSETDEAFQLVLSSPTNGLIDGDPGTITITDNDPAALSIEGVVLVDEGDSGQSDAVFPVRLSTIATKLIEVDYETQPINSSNMAVAGVDYVAQQGTLTFPNGQTLQEIHIPIIGNTADDAFRTFAVVLSNPSNAQIADGYGVCGILDDDGPDITIDDVAVDEGDSGTTLVNFTVGLSAATPDYVSVEYRTSDNTASEFFQDYVAASGKLEWQPGDTTTRQISVAVNGDTVGENDESFYVVLQNPVNASLPDLLGEATIRNDDGMQPVVSVASASTAEGDSGITVFEFPVTLSEAAQEEILVDWYAQGITATGGQDFDDSEAFGTLTFAVGTSGPEYIKVDVFGDTTPEPDEIIEVSLNAPQNVTIGGGAATGTILNDDGTLPTVAIAGTSITEGDSGTVQANFSVTLSAAFASDVLVDYYTSDVTAVAGDDYVQSSGTVTFPTNSTTPQTISVDVYGDTLAEFDENFRVTLNTPVNATISAGTAMCSIINDDGTPPAFSISDATIVEGDSGTSSLVFTVTMSDTAPVDAQVDWFTSDKTATEGSDYVSNFGTVVFPANISSPQTINVEIYGDTNVEADEELTVTLNTPMNAQIDDGLGIGTIENDDFRTSSLVLNHLLGISTLSPGTGDGNGDGVIDLADAIDYIQGGD